MDHEAWADEEFGKAMLRDSRRLRRLVSMGAKLAQRPSATVTGAFRSEREVQAAYDFLEHDDNEQEWSDVAMASHEACASRCLGHPSHFGFVHSTHTGLSPMCPSRSSSCASRLGPLPPAKSLLNESCTRPIRSKPSKTRSRWHARTRSLADRKLSLHDQDGRRPPGTKPTPIVGWLCMWITLHSAVAARHQHILHRARTEPDVLALEEFSEVDAEAARLLHGQRSGRPVAPAAQLKLGELVLIVAKLGGYIGSPSKVPPGIQVFERGMADVLPASEALTAMRRAGLVVPDVQRPPAPAGGPEGGCENAGAHPARDETNA
jgi:hypothetical protein